MDCSNYLRNHHWKNGIPVDFIKEWALMNYTNYSLNDKDINDFESIFKRFNIDKGLLLEVLAPKKDSNQLLGEQILEKLLEALKTLEQKKFMLG